MRSWIFVAAISAFDKLVRCRGKDSIERGEYGPLDKANSNGLVRLPDQGE